MRAWENYRAAQEARRHVRIKARLDQLRALLPASVAVETIADAHDVILSGHGLRLRYSPLHNNVAGTGVATRSMSPQQVANEFRWRWKRDGCPAR